MLPSFDDTRNYTFIKYWAKQKLEEIIVIPKSQMSVIIFLSNNMLLLITYCVPGTLPAAKEQTTKPWFCVFKSLPYWILSLEMSVKVSTNEENCMA